MSRKGLVLFLKYPEKGKTKTRLAKDIGDDLAIGLYDCFVRDLVPRFGLLDCDLHLFLTPARRIPDTHQWLDTSLPIHPQAGKDLGERMKNAFSTLFRLGYESCLIMGGDIPDVPSEFPQKAFEALETAGAAIAPTLDGGYYLIGFQRSRFCEAVFHNVQWSTETVFRQTMTIFQREGEQPAILPQWQDVDNFSDLKQLLERNLEPGKDSPFHGSLTMQYLLNHREEIFGDQN